MSKLYILKAKKEFTGYIHNQNVVVRADTEKEAREMATYADRGVEQEWNESYATCEELLAKGEHEVIIEDNNRS